MVKAHAASDEAASTQRADAARIYRAHVDAVYGYVVRRLGSELAGDVVADTFRISIEDLDRFAYRPRHGTGMALRYRHQPDASILANRDPTPESDEPARERLLPLAEPCCASWSASTQPAISRGS